MPGGYPGERGANRIAPVAVLTVPCARLGR
jgi:hypothetical protein